MLQHLQPEQLTGVVYRAKEGGTLRLFGNLFIDKILHLVCNDQRLIVVLPFRLERLTVTLQLRFCTFSKTYGSWSQLKL